MNPTKKTKKAIVAWAVVPIDGKFGDFMRENPMNLIFITKSRAREYIVDCYWEEIAKIIKVKIIPI